MVGQYKLGDSINDMPSFLSSHCIRTQFSQKYDEEITHSFKSNDEAYSVLVTNDLIDSVQCHEIFIIENNIIGEHLSQAIIEIVNRFGGNSAIFICDTQIEYDDGDIQMDVDFDELGLVLTVNLDGIILSVGVVGNDAD